MKPHLFLIALAAWIIPSVATFAQEGKLVGTEDIEYETDKNFCCFHISVDYPVDGDPHAMAVMKDFVIDMVDFYKFFEEDDSYEAAGAHQRNCPKMKVENTKDLQRYIKTYCNNACKEVVENMKKADDQMYFERSLTISRQYQNPSYVAYLVKYRYGRGIDVMTATVPYMIRKRDGLRISQPFKEEALATIEKMVLDHPECYFDGEGNLDMVEDINDYKKGKRHTQLKFSLPSTGGWIDDDYVYMQYCDLEMFGTWCPPRLRFSIDDMMPYLKDEVKELIGE